MASIPLPKLECIPAAESSAEPSNRDTSFAAFVVGALVAKGCIPYSTLVDEPSAFITATQTVARCLQLLPEHDAFGDWVELPL